MHIQDIISNGLAQLLADAEISLPDCGQLFANSTIWLNWASTSQKYARIKQLSKKSYAYKFDFLNDEIKEKCFTRNLARQVHPFRRWTDLILYERFSRSPGPGPGGK